MINYNTYIFEFENYDELDEYIVVDDNWMRVNHYYFDSTKGGKLIKVWKVGKITDLKNKKVNTVNYKGHWYWKFRNNEYEVKKIIWDIYSEKYNLKKIFIIGNKFTQFGYKDRKLDYKDGDFNNLRVDNLIKYEFTYDGLDMNKEVAIYVDVNINYFYDNKNDYFDFNLNIPNDNDEFIQCDEPVILGDFPYFQIYRNGNIIDTRGKSRVLLDKNGYQTISYKKNYFVHRLVAISYLKNKYSYNLVNHIDGNRSNNDVNNLEWVNNTINTLHGQLTKKCNISLTSHNYRNFIKERIILEYKMGVDKWIFSHTTPLFLLFLPMIGKFGFDKIKTNFMWDRHFDDVVLEIDDIFFKNNNKLSGLDVENNDNVWLLVECINKYLIPKDTDDHLLNILKILKIDFDDYIDFLFDDLKLIIKHDVSFIFFKEISHYINLMNRSIGNVRIGKVYNSEIIKPHLEILLQNIRDEKSRDILVYEEKYGRIIDYNYRYHRIVERLEHVHIHNVKRLEIENDIMLLMTYWNLYKRFR